MSDMNQKYDTINKKLDDLLEDRLSRQIALALGTEMTC